MEEFILVVATAFLTHAIPRILDRFFMSKDKVTDFRDKLRSELREANKETSEKLTSNEAKLEELRSRYWRLAPITMQIIAVTEAILANNPEINGDTRTVVSAAKASLNDLLQEHG